MKILMLYDNFVRDFRGLLLLKHLLTARGHKVWLRATWNEPLSFAQLMKIDVLAGGQIAEAATHFSGKFAKENNIRFVLNSTENVGVAKNFEMFVTYNTSELNDEIIDLQTVAAKDVYEFIMNNPKVKLENKKKYKHLGFPRLDLTVNESFRNIESSAFKKKYKLHDKGKVYLFISSFLLDGAFDGVPERDLEKWNISEMKKRTNDLLQVTSNILSRLMNEVFGENDVLLIKKHPWDCSSYFNDNFQSKKCIVLDKNDYILPCIYNSDFVLHTYSTAAIEAWLLEKKSISIFLEEYKDSATLNHMEHELSVSSFEELKILLNNYPAENPSVKALEIFSPNLDGKATIRLANEINKLKPYPPLPKTAIKMSLKTRLVTEFWKWIHVLKNPVEKSRIAAEAREWLFDHGVFKHEVDKRAIRNTKGHDFFTWENERARVIKLYKKSFKKYARQYIKEGL